MGMLLSRPRVALPKLGQWRKCSGLGISFKTRGVTHGFSEAITNGYLDLGVLEPLTMFGNPSIRLSCLFISSRIKKIGSLIACLLGATLCYGCTPDIDVSDRVSEGMRQVSVFPPRIPAPWLPDGIFLGPMRYGYADRNRKIVIPPQYQEIGDFEEGLAAVKLNEKYGFIDHLGKLVIAYQFDDAEWFSEGMAGVRIGNLWGFVDSRGRLAIPPRFSGALPFECGVSKVSISVPGVSTTTDFVNREGKRVAMPKFSAACHLSEGLMGVEIKGKWGFKDTQENLVILAQYDDVKPFHEGLAGVKIGGKWGFINPMGKMIIKPTFHQVDSFSEGLAKIGVANKKVSLKMADACGKWGFIDRSGKYVVPPKYDVAENFIDGRAMVYFRDKEGFVWSADPGHVDRQGKYMPPKGDRSGAQWGYQYKQCI
jgi:hypothetical protein